MPTKKDKQYSKIIDETTGDAMSEDEIRAFFPNAKIIRYTDLKKYKTLKQLLPKKKDFAIILYQNSEYEGHWTLIAKDGDYIEYFDSYGKKIDEPLNWITKKENNDLGIYEPYLSNLVKGAGKKLYYNDKQFQHSNNDINTCGRWCLWRLMNLFENGRDIGDFKKLMETLKKKLKCPYDDIVSGFINEITAK